MRKNQNVERIEGYVYQHELSLKQVQNQNSENFGKNFISGTVDVATDEEGINLVPVHYTFVTEYTKAGKKNGTYAILKQIIDEEKTWIKVGKDEALKVRLEPSLDLNDFYVNDELVSAKRNEGGFARIVTALAPENRSYFEVDTIITNATLIEADEEKNIPEDYLSLRGVVFNFRNEIKPVDFTVRAANGMKYFDSLDISPSNPVYTKVWGKITTRVIKSASAPTESAWGESVVFERERKVKEWEITGSQSEVYEFGAEGVITAAELTECMQNREVYLAEVKKRAEEYAASQSAPAAPAAGFGGIAQPSTPVNNAAFKF